jgi:hypothetical protein
MPLRQYESRISQAKSVGCERVHAANGTVGVSAAMNRDKLRRCMHGPEAVCNLPRSGGKYASTTAHQVREIQTIDLFGLAAVSA